MSYEDVDLERLEAERRTEAKRSAGANRLSRSPRGAERSKGLRVPVTFRLSWTGKPRLLRRARDADRQLARGRHQRVGAPDPRPPPGAGGSISAPTRPKGPDVLELLDLRERGERLEAVRPEIDPTVSETVQRILQRVFVEGDEVLIELAQRFDDADLSADRADGAPRGVRRGRARDARRSQTGPRCVDRADARSPRPPAPHRSGGRSPTGFATARSSDRSEPSAATSPAGARVYPSSVCMTVVPAVVAGVPEIVLCTPPRADGTIHPAVLYAAKRAGATYVAKTGGAQAIAAMAYGTETIPQVDRIVGPGNAYVTEAKRQLCGTVGIDALAGPERARDRHGRRRRPRARGARPDRAGGARPARADVPDHAPTSP